LFVRTGFLVFGWGGKRPSPPKGEEKEGGRCTTCGRPTKELSAKSWAQSSGGEGGKREAGTDTDFHQHRLPTSTPKIPITWGKPAYHFRGKKEDIGEEVLNTPSQLRSLLVNTGNTAKRAQDRARPLHKRGKEWRVCSPGEKGNEKEGQKKIALQEGYLFYTSKRNSRRST